MKEYDFVSLDTDYGTGYSLFGGFRIDTMGHREIIREKAAAGWTYAGYIPTAQRASGQIDTLDLVFVRETEGPSHGTG